MVDESAGTGAQEKREITLGQLRAMRDRAHRLMDYLTAMSGYSQIALASEPRSSTQVELEKIVRAVHHASHDVLFCITSLNELENSSPDSKSSNRSSTDQGL